MTAIGRMFGVRACRLSTEDGFVTLDLSCIQPTQSAYLPQLLGERILAVLAKVGPRILSVSSHAGLTKVRLIVDNTLPLQETMDKLMEFPPIPTLLVTNGWTVVAQEVFDRTASLTVRRAEKNPAMAPVMLARLVRAMQAEGWSSQSWEFVPPFWFAHFAKDMDK